MQTRPDPKLLDPTWIRETMLKLIRSGIEGFVDYWGKELSGIDKIDGRLTGKSAKEVAEIYIASLVAQPLQEIERLYALSREGRNPAEWISSFKKYMAIQLDKTEKQRDIA